VSLVYTVASGLYGVVWTDFFQAVLILLMIAYVAAVAFTIQLPETLSVSMPLVNGQFSSIQTRFADWSSVWPRWHLGLDGENAYSIYNWFGIAIMFYLFKVTFEGSGGATNYMAQRYFAAKNDREAGLISLLWTLLLSFRWIFVGALAVWGLSLGSQITDPEKVLPIVVDSMPLGIKGFLIAGFMAAAMSTFVSTVNAGAAYWVKDIYLEHINPNATTKSAMRQSYLSSTLIVVVGLALTLLIKNINEVWGWITMSISAGMIIPMMIRWYWWRINGYGYTIGLIAGTLAAVIWKLVMPSHVAEYYAFIFSGGLSLLGTIVGTLLTEPTGDGVLENFYNTTRPFGFWDRFKNRLQPSVIQSIDRENRRDIRSVLIALPWQVILFLFMMSLVFKTWLQTAILFVALVILSAMLYFNYFLKLSTEVKLDRKADQ